MWHVHVVEYETEKSVKLLEYESERTADKADAGLTRQLNHERFFTVIYHVDECSYCKEGR